MESQALYDAKQEIARLNKRVSDLELRNYALTLQSNARAAVLGRIRGALNDVALFG